MGHSYLMHLLSSLLVFKSNDGFGVWQGTDLTMLRKMNEQHKENKVYIGSKSERDTDFGIQHYAGVVNYDSTGTQTNHDDSWSPSKCFAVRCSVVFLFFLSVKGSWRRTEMPSALTSSKWSRYPRISSSVRSSRMSFHQMQCSSLATRRSP